MRGMRGPRGLQGIQGIQGVKGDTGSTGAQGVQGIQGDKGDTGSQGPKGDTGNTGATGSAGVGVWRGAYSAGTAYAVGDLVSDTGSTYIAILAGTGHSPASSPSYWSVVAAKGDTGNTGAAGTNGANGSNGAAGTNGATWTSGTSAPSGGVDGDFYFRTDTGVIYKKISGSWTAQATLPLATAGRVIQVVQGFATAPFTTTSTSLVDITGWTATITPTSTTSKILVLVAANVSNSSGGYGSVFQLQRNGTAVGNGGSSGSETEGIGQFNSGQVTGNVGINFLDAPGSTSALTYKVQGLVQSGATMIVGRRGDQPTPGSNYYAARTPMSIILMEISG